MPCVPGALQVWLLYSAITLYYLWACTFKKLDKTLPKQVRAGCASTQRRMVPWEGMEALQAMRGMGDIPIGLSLSLSLFPRSPSCFLLLSLAAPSTPPPPTPFSL